MSSKGTHDVLSELRGSSLQSTGTENGDGKDLGPIDIVRAVAVVTVVESGATLAGKIQGSATEDGTYYDIPGGAFADPADGAAIDTVGIYEIYIKTAFRWLRYNSVVATDDITHQCLLTAV
jgi:hypothetical protein